MSNEKFTQGEWRVCNGTNIFTDLGATNSAGVKALDSDGWCIADCDSVAMTLVDDGDTDYLPYDEIKANAHLISAAPDMYQALKMCQRLLIDRGFGLSTNAQQVINNALTKAEGEPQ